MSELNVVERDIITEMNESFLSYALSIITDRAIPNIKDGCKPVHRKILYTMWEDGLLHNTPHRKSTRTIGNCFVAGTKISTLSGLKNIEDIVVGDRVYTQNGVTSVSELFEMPKQELIELELKHSMPKITATKDQMFKVLTRDLSYTWKSACDIVPGDMITCCFKYPNDLKYVKLAKLDGVDRYLNEDIAYLFGQLISNGHVENGYGSSINSIRICFTGASEAVAKRICKLIEEQFGYTPTIEWRKIPYKRVDGNLTENKVFHIRINRKSISDWFAASFGVDGSWKAFTKYIPTVFFISPKSVAAMLLSGLIDGDGCVYNVKNDIHYGTISPRLADDVQALYRILGIPSRVYVTECSRFKDSDAIYGRFKHNHNYFNVHVYGRFVTNIAKIVTLSNELRAERIKNVRSYAVSEFDIIPNSGILFTELSKHHLGGGWYSDITGKKFRNCIKYASGTKICHYKNLSDKQFTSLQIKEWGILENLERIGSKYCDFLHTVIDNDVFFIPVSHVNSVSEDITYDLQVEDESHEFIANSMVVHNCMSRYYVHGDAGLYTTIVRLAQPFSMRYPLIDGQGNFGSVDGDPAASARYTEIRMSKIAEEMMLDLEKNAVDFVSNYDETLKEPSVLPSKLPNILLNGNEGIAVGMASNFAPHNLCEVVDNIISYIDDPDTVFSIAPDFPTGGIIIGRRGYNQAYMTGRGPVTLRGKVEIEDEKRHQQIVITEIPYQVNKATLTENIANLSKDDTIKGISDIRDESDKDGIRLVIEVKNGFDTGVIVNQLYKYTELQITFGINMTTLINGVPKQVSLRDVIHEHVEHRKTVISRRTQFDLTASERRLHILNGLLIALDNIDEVVKIIRGSDSSAIARELLIDRFAFSEEQVKSILDMKLSRLTGLERGKIVSESSELEVLITRLRAILEDRQQVLDIIKSDLLELKSKYGDARRTQIIDDEINGTIDIEDIIQDEEVIVTVSNNGYVKRTSLEEYRLQRRGGKGSTGSDLKIDDYVVDVFAANTKDYLLLFTADGKVHWLRVYEIPQSAKNSKGKLLANLISLTDKVVSILPVKSFDSGFIMASMRSGNVVRMELSDFSNPRRGGIKAINLDDDNLVTVVVTTGTDDIILATKHGKAIRFSESEIRITNRGASGVRGIRLGPDDQIVSLDIVKNESSLLTITSSGYGKCTSLDEYIQQSRGGTGVKSIQLANNRVCAVMSVMEDDEILVATKLGTMIRLPISQIRVQGRATRGVRIMDVADGDEVITVSKIQ